METDIEKQAVTSASRPTPETSPSSSDGSKLTNFAWRDVSYAVDTKNGKKQILQNVSGCVEKGRPDATQSKK